VSRNFYCARWCGCGNFGEAIFSLRRHVREDQASQTRRDSLLAGLLGPEDALDPARRRQWLATAYRLIWPNFGRGNKVFMQTKRYIKICTERMLRDLQFLIVFCSPISFPTYLPLQLRGCMPYLLLLWVCACVCEGGEQQRKKERDECVRGKMGKRVQDVCARVYVWACVCV